MGLGSVLDGCGKSRPHRDSNPEQERKRNAFKNKLEFPTTDIKIPLFDERMLRIKILGCGANFMCA